MIAIGILLGLILLNAFFAASEIAFVSLNNKKIEMMAEDGHKKAIMIHKLIQEPSRYLATIQIGVTLAGFLASAFAAENFAHQLTNYLASMGVPIAVTVLESISVVLITLILSFFTLVFGELVPKRVALNKYEQISMLVARPLTILSVIATPFVKLLTVSTNLIVKLLGIDPHSNERPVTEEEIRMMVDAGREHGTIQESEKTMIENIFEFDDTIANEVMTHRTNIQAIEIDSTLDEIIQLINEKKHTRYPVYEGSIDNIVGILHVFDILQLYNKDQQTIKLKDIISKPFFVTESKRTDELLVDMQRNKINMVVVIDEYGGTAGIVTIEDLLEEIVGEIYDEHDKVVHLIQKIDNDTFLLQGTISLDEVQAFFDIPFPIETYETLSGFIIGQLGHIPEADEHPTIEYRGLVMRVEKSDERRIHEVKISRQSNTGASFELQTDRE